MIISRLLVTIGLFASLMFVPGGLYGKLSDLFGNSTEAESGVVTDKTVLTIQVSPSGEDKAPSSYTKGHVGPLKTINYALKVAQKIQRDKLSRKPIVIALDSGIYRLKTALAFNKKLGGSAEQPLTLRGAADGSSIIRGSYVLNERVSTRKLPAALRRRLSSHQHKNVIAYKIPSKYLKIPSIETHRLHYKTSNPLPFALHDQQGSLHPAQYPNKGDDWLKIRSIKKKDPKSFVSSSPHLRRWSGEPDLWAGGYWKWNWAYETLPISKINTRRRTVTLKQAPHYNMKSANRYFVFHALGELDKPGEWYLDKKRGYLIVWPRKPLEEVSNLGEQKDNNIELSLSNSLISVFKASHIKFEQLVLEYSRHDAILVKNSHHIDFNHCIIRWVGGRAAFFKNSKDSGIANSTITDTASGGIVLDGGSRKTLTPARLYSRNNRILRYARLGKTYKPAIQLLGVGNIAYGNYIAQSPHFAISFLGNDHLIERNEITDVSNDTSDSGAIYTGRDWSSRGTKIINNYLHDIQPKTAGFETKAVYLDDMASGIEISGNLFFRVEQPIFIGGGRDNIVERNMIIASKPGIYMDARGLTWAKNSIINGNSEIRSHLRAVPYTSEIWRNRYPHLANILKDDAASPKYNVLRHNLFVAGSRYLIEAEVNKSEQTIGTDYGPNNVSVRSSYHINDYVETAKRAEDFIPLTHKGYASNLSEPLPLGQMDRWGVSGWRIDSSSDVRD